MAAQNQPGKLLFIFTIYILPFCELPRE